MPHSNKISRIAILLVGPYKMSGGMARTATMLCDALLRTDPELEVVFGASHLTLDDVRPLIDVNSISRLEMRELFWGLQDDSDGTRWVRPQTRSGYDYMDCDAWIFWHQPTLGVIAPLRPFAVFCADLLLRIVPQAYLLEADQSLPEWSEVIQCFKSYRCANMIFCTTPRTLEDVVGFAGVPRSHVSLAPPFAVNSIESSCEAPSLIPFKNYFLWTSNDTPHKNHLRAFQMLDLYYSNFPEEVLPVVLTGYHTMRFNPERLDLTTSPYHNQIRKFLAEKPHILKNIYFAETMPRPEFLSALKQAAFLWHNVIYDNGTASVFEAAEYGVPSLVTDYPQMRYFDEKYKSKARFFSAFDIEGGAQALINMTRHVRSKTAQPVQIDYEEENTKFYDWCKWLLSYMSQQEANRGSQAADIDAVFNASHGAAALLDNAMKVWPALQPYLTSFPWSDVPVAALVLSNISRPALVQLILMFEAALRQHYINFKLLVLLPNNSEYLNFFKDLILHRVLAFDILYGGTTDKESNLITVTSLSQVIFSDSDNTIFSEQKCETLGQKKLIRLRDAQSANALASMITEGLKNIQLTSCVNRQFTVWRR